MAAEWPHTASPFHRGEREVQRRLGVPDDIDLLARRMVRDFMPDQHREFYANLPFLLLGAVDRAGRPWATLVSGAPGFVSTPDDRVLNIAARPLFGDPVFADLRVGADVGVLGIELETRRRNRAVGRVSRIDGAGLSIAVDQSFGNCPQYIQTRTVHALPSGVSSGISGGLSSGAPSKEGRRPQRMDRFDASLAALIEKADTFFIATVFRDGENAIGQGADVSHRGGMPGFVRLEDDRTFSFPDYPGNRYFNTLGNIHLNPKAGFLFIDFEAGDLVYMTGDAEIVWNDTEGTVYTGAGRRIRFRVAEVSRVPHGGSLHFTFGEYSPSHRRLALREA